MLSMLEGVDVVCFAACYFLAFIIEIVRFVLFKDRYQSAYLFSVLFASFGVIAHLFFLFHNDLLQNDHFFASAGGWFSVLAFTVALSALYLAVVCPKTQFGLFFYPLALALTGIAICAQDVLFTQKGTCFCVRSVHGASLLIATLLSFVGVLAGAMYLVQRRRLKGRLTHSSFYLPSLEWLSRVCRFAANHSVIALGLGVASGFYLKAFSGAQARLDLVSIGTPILFGAALIARLPRRRKKAIDECAVNAVHNFIVGASLTILLISALWGIDGHWRHAFIPASFNNYAQQEQSTDHLQIFPSFNG